MKNNERDSLRRYLNKDPNADLNNKISYLESLKSELEARVDTLLEENYRL